ncbi:hypothetical protein N4T77_18935 [Clostridium sp. CX1]|nr:hypothetical protein [Clostridium sp. CX1]MCT8978669.1 hypothetical protein [Clostridium sp. CX1]
MERRDFTEELKSKIPRIVESLSGGKEITIQVTPKGLKVKEADIKIIK